MEAAFVPDPEWWVVEAKEEGEDREEEEEEEETEMGGRLRESDLFKSLASLFNGVLAENQGRATSNVHFFR